MPWSEKQAFEETRTGNHVVVRASPASGAAWDLTGQILAFGDAGAIIGRVQNVSTSIATGAHEISELGDPDPKEIVDGLHRYSVTIDSLTFRSADAVGVVYAGPVDIEISDQFGGAPVKRLFGCRLADERFQVGKHTEVARNLTFIALGEV